MKSEINNEILKFKTRWKHHNLSIIMGFLSVLVLLVICILIFHTIIFYSGDNKVLVIMVELCMCFVTKKLRRNIMPDKETRDRYITEYRQLDEKIQIMMKLKMDTALNQLIQQFKKEEK
jgi:cytochrome c biogenesis protein CcdA